MQFNPIKVILNSHYGRITEPNKGAFTMNEIQGAMERKPDGSATLVVNYGMMTVAKMTRNQFAQFVKWCNEVSASVGGNEIAVYHFPTYKPAESDLIDRSTYEDRKV